MAYWLDEGWHSWPEVVRAGTAAAGLYARCGAYIADHLLDGLVPAEVARMYGTPEWVQRLVEVGLWRTEEAGFRDMRYFPLNPTREKVEQRRKQHAARQARYWAKRQQRTSDASADRSGTRPPSLKGRGLVAPHPFESNGHAGGCCNLPESHPVHRRPAGP